MSINNITQNITAIPPAGHRGVDVQTIFVNKQEAFQDALTDVFVNQINMLRTQLNTFVSETNIVATQVNTNATNANTSATTATTQAGIATTKAGEATTSATQALTYRNQAETFANQASASASSVDASNIVHRTGDESISGIKTFNSSPIVPTPTTGTQAVNKDYVDNVATLNINALTNKSAPIDTDNLVIQENGGLLKKLSWLNLKTTLLSYFDGFYNRKVELITLTETATFSPTGQTINMTGIGSLGLAIGDVIQVVSPLNTRLHTVENIPNANQIVVNYEHRGTSSPAPQGRLTAETATTTISLYLRAKDAGQNGLYWCVPASGRAINTTYTNTLNREIKIRAIASSINTTLSSIDSINFHIQNYTPSLAFFPISITYKTSIRLNGDSVIEWIEKR